jgi:hypothetical protein
MRGIEDDVREDVLCEFYSPGEGPRGPFRHSQRAIRTQRWKLAWYPLIGRYQLFDLRHDPLELTDLLTPWRRRRRLAVDAGASVWRKDAWAARDSRPPYSERDIEAAAADLHQRMLSQMEKQGDPILEETRPPPP